MRLLGRARLAGHDERTGRVLSDLELAAVLQRGAATRLLDCTYNAYIALWFASRDTVHRDDWGLLMGLEAAKAKVIRTAEERDQPMHDLLQSLDAQETFALWWPAALSPRKAQQGFFVFSPVVEEISGSVRFRGDQLHETGSVPGLTLFAVSPELKSLMTDQWEALFGYTEERLFPDLDGFAQVHAAGAEFRLTSSPGLTWSPSGASRKS